MARSKVEYRCAECGGLSPKWVGQCPDCGAWNSLSDVPIARSGGASPTRYAGYAGAADQGVVRDLASVHAQEKPRRRAGIDELDRVLGGGLVAGSVVLIGGDPGIGKSTLLLQAVAALSEQAKSLYITGEESPEQVSLRARRLELSGCMLRVLAETSVERILEQAQIEAPQVVVVDSIQTIYSELLQSAPGSVGQVRESASQLVRFAKRTGTTVFLVGHVTKEGTLAGPRVLEHMVDTVLYFEGDPGMTYRVVRTIKNRFGAVNELGVFAMTGTGLKGVRNPSSIFLSRHPQPVPGSVTLVTMEGTRPLLVEVQALVDESRLSSPRRVALGMDNSRLAMLLAVQHRHGGVSMSERDVFVNVVGGVRVNETAADLAVLLAVLSSLRDTPLPRELVVFGEIGLAGEIRPVPNGQPRLHEAAKLGFETALVPTANAPKGSVRGLEVQAVSRYVDVLEWFAESQCKLPQS